MTKLNFPAEALTVFRHMQTIDEQCTCLERDWEGAYWKHKRCAACEEWSHQHSRLHDLLRLRPDQWPAIEHPDTESVPGNAAYPQPDREARGRYRLLEKAAGERESIR